MVNLLLAKGANINAFDKKDRRALHWAAYMGKAQLVWISCWQTNSMFYGRQDADLSMENQNGIYAVQGKGCLI